MKTSRIRKEILHVCPTALRHAHETLRLRTMSWLGTARVACVGVVTALRIRPVGHAPCPG
jgi:uroporphyrinogen-III synthase